MPLSNALVHTLQIIDHLLLGQTLKKKSFHFIKNVIYIYVGGGSEESDWCDTFYFNGAWSWFWYIRYICQLEMLVTIYTSCGIPSEYYKMCFAKVVVVHSINLLMTNWQIEGTQWRHCPCHSAEWHGNKHDCFEYNTCIWKRILCQSALHHPDSPMPLKKLESRF